MSKPILYIYDTVAAGGVDFELAGQLSDYTDLEFTRAWAAPGSFSIKVHADLLGASYIKENRIVYIDEARVGWIESVEEKRSKDKSNEFIIARGVELKDMLYRWTLPQAGEDTDNYTAVKAETVIKAIIDKNAGSSAESNRQLPNVLTAPDQSRGTTIDFSTRHKKLRDEIFSILAQDRMGLICTYDIDAQQIVFDVAEGVDRTEGQSVDNHVILSTSDYASAMDYDYKKDQSGYRNFAYVAGQGEGKDRTIETVFEGSSEPTGYLRRELFVDARDVENDGELPDRGAQKLSETTKAVGIKVKFNNNGAFSIDDDFTCGDFVTAKSERSTDDAQVVKVTYKYSGSIGYPTVNLVLDFDPDDIERVITTRLNQYDSLLSKETDTNTLVPKGLQASDNHCVIPMTDGHYESSLYATYGYIKITLPVNQRHIIHMVVDVSIHMHDKNAQLILTGLTDTSDGRWEECSASMLGSLSNSGLPCRFGVDTNGNFAIWLGESTTHLPDVAVRVRDVQVNYNTPNINDYATGWGVEIVSSIEGTVNKYCCPESSVINTNEDLNDYKSCGMYHCPLNVTVATLSSCPTIYAFSLLVEKHAGYKQTLTEYLRETPRTYMRNYYNGTWGSWYKQLSGGRLPDNTNADITPVENTYRCFRSWTGYNRPATYVDILHFGIKSTNGFQLASSFAGSTNEFYLRGKWDNGGWKSWARVWTAINAPSVSSSRYKENIENYTVDVGKLLELQPKKFDFISDLQPFDGKTHIGLIAEEVEPICPDLVYYVNNDDESEEQDVLEGVKYQDLTVMLLGLCKQQQEKIDELEQRIIALEG